MAPGSVEQMFEEKLARLEGEIELIIRYAERNPGVIAHQDMRTQLFLSALREWKRGSGPALKAVS